MVDPYPEFPQANSYSVTNHPGSGYQAKFTVSWKPGMRSDFRNIRYHDNLGRKIPYWIESKTDGSTATVWIKLTSSKIVILRWGSSSAVSESNINNVMEFYDEFSGTSLSSKWTNSGITTEFPGDGTIRCRKTVSGSQYITSTQNFAATGYTLQFRGKFWVTGHGLTTVGFQNANDKAVWGWREDDGQFRITNTNNTVSSSYSNGTTGSGTFLTFEIKLTADHTYYYKEGELFKTPPFDTNIPDTSMPIVIGQNMQTYSADAYIDYIFVRKSADIDPTFTLVSSQYIYSIPYEILTTSTPAFSYYPIIEYNEDNEMFQIVSTIKAHPFQIRSLTSPGDPATTCTNPTVTVRTYTAGGTVSSDNTTLDSSDISAYSNANKTFYITIPASFAANAYDALEINVSCDEGEGFLMVNIVPNPSTFATAAALTTVDTVVDTISTNVSALNNLSSSDVSTAVWTTPGTRTITEVPTGGALEATLGAVKTITDQLTLTAINAQCDLAVSEYGAATPAQVLTQLQTYDAPTYTEMTAAFTAIKGSGWTTETLKAIKEGELTTAQVNTQCANAISSATLATAASIAALNNVSTAQVLAQAEQALTNKGIATATNVTNATSPLATASALATVDGIVDTINSNTAAITPAVINAQCDQALTDFSSSDLMRILSIMANGSITGLVSGNGSPVYFTKAGVGKITFTVDNQGNRTFSTVEFY